VIDREKAIYSIEEMQEIVRNSMDFYFSNPPSLFKDHLSKVEKHSIDILCLDAKNSSTPNKQVRAI
jgi:hypothetical protein